VAYTRLRTAATVCNASLFMLARTAFTTRTAAELDPIGAGIGDFDPLLLFKKAGERFGHRMKNPGPMKPGM
jgi:hypothetical protein